MSTTIVEALREHIIAGALPSIGSKFYLDWAPDDTVPPYLTCNDVVSQTPSLQGGGRVIEYARQLQVNLFQRYEDEDPQLPALLEGHLDGALLSVDGMLGVRKVSVDSLTKLSVQKGEGIVHHELTLSITHPSGIA